MIYKNLWYNFCYNIFMKKCGIYKIISPSNKVYIGQSTNIEFRFSSYKNLKRCNKQTKLFASFQKYGTQNHTFEIIEECIESELNKRERHWQEYYDVLNKDKGLNLRLQKLDDKSGKLSAEVINKIRNSNLGKKRSDEFKKNCSERLKGKCLFTKEQIEKTANLKRGVTRSKDVINSISKTKRASLSYTIIQTDLNNNFIKEWQSLAQIKEQTGFDKSNIHNCLTGKYKYSHGYKWYKKYK